MLKPYVSKEVSGVSNTLKNYCFQLWVFKSHWHECSKLTGVFILLELWVVVKKKYSLDNFSKTAE
jgi:hypothetical protein